MTKWSRGRESSGVETFEVKKHHIRKGENNRTVGIGGGRLGYDDTRIKVRVEVLNEKWRDKEEMVC